MKSLIIAPDIPWPHARHGAAQRTELLRRALSRVCETDLAVACVAPGDKTPEQLQATGVFCEEVPGFTAPSRSVFRWRRSLENARTRIEKYYAINNTLADWVEKSILESKYDFVVVRYLRSGAISGILHQNFRVPVILDFDDVDWAKEASRIRRLDCSLKQRAAMSIHNRYRERYCRRLARQSSHIWTVSHKEAMSIRPLRSEVLPNIPMSLPDTTFTHQSSECVILFVGLLNYGPNNEGVDWFIREVWQKVIGELPDARFRIVGKGLDPETAARWQAIDGIELLGFVPDLCDEYRRCSATVCPVFWGGGSNIKVLESLGYGRPCVVSRRVGDQFKADLGHQTGVYSCDDANAFLRHVLHLMKPSAASAAAVARGMKIISERFSFDHFAAIVERDVRRVLSSGSKVSR